MSRGTDKADAVQLGFDLTYNNAALERRYWVDRTELVLLSMDYQFNIFSTPFWIYFLYRSKTWLDCGASLWSACRCSVGTVSLLLATCVHHWWMTRHKSWYVSRRGRLIVWVKLCKMFVLPLIRELTPMEVLSRYLACSHTAWCLPKLMLTSGIMSQIMLTVFHQGPWRQQWVLLLTGFALYLSASTKVTSACMSSEACTSSVLNFSSTLVGFLANAIELVTGMPFPVRTPSGSESFGSVEHHQQVYQGMLFLFLSMGVVLPLLVAYLTELSTKTKFAVSLGNGEAGSGQGDPQERLTFPVPYWSLPWLVVLWLLLSLMTVWMVLQHLIPTAPVGSLVGLW